jgi:SAM-dependent methyltransferase
MNGTLLVSVSDDGVGGAVARRGSGLAGLEDRVAAHVLDVRSIDRLGETPFDGAISAFAGLSALPDLTSFADHMADLLRPGGRLVVHMINRFSSWEWLGLMAHGQWRAAIRLGRQRRRTFVIGGQPVDHALYFPLEAYRRFFVKAFRLRKTYSLGALRPPHTVRRLPRGLVSALEWLDVRGGRWPLVRNAGRFFVLDLERLA